MQHLLTQSRDAKNITMMNVIDYPIYITLGQRSRTPDAMADVRFTFEKEGLRPAMVCDDVEGLEIDNFRAQLSAGVPAAVWTGLKGIVARNLPELDGIQSK